MIPKKIHYCWFGRGEKPKLAKRCIASWKKYCPDYEIIEWNEDNFDVNCTPYTKLCYDNKKYAFLSDYVRLIVLEKAGGIYMDTDVELCRTMDPLLVNKAYIGFETNNYVNSGQGFGSEAHGEMVRAMIAEYDYLLDGINGIIGCPILNTNALVKLGLEKNGALQHLPFATVYPSDWFNPYEDTTGRLFVTSNTYSIHWYSKSWMAKHTILRCILTRPYHRLLKILKVGSFTNGAKLFL